MRGAEYVTAEALAAVWREAGEAFAAELSSWKGPVAEWLHAKNAAWATVGRVCFHLAENKRDPARPSRSSRRTRRASRRRARRSTGRSGTRSKSRARRAIASSSSRCCCPCSARRRRARSCGRWSTAATSTIRSRWTPREALRVPEGGARARGRRASSCACPTGGRRARRRGRRSVVRVGRTIARRSSAADAVLDFSASLALDGEPLSAAERRAHPAGHRRPRPHQGAVGRGRRRAAPRGARALEAGRAARRSATASPFHEAMRLLAGRPRSSRTRRARFPTRPRAWSRVEPGPWMKGVLDGLRAPDALAAGRERPGRRARARSLRPYQRVGVQWLWWAHELGLGVCLADDMGLGKTLQVLALLLLRRRSRGSRSGAPRRPRVARRQLEGGGRAVLPRACGCCVAHAASTGAAELAAAPSEDVDAADAVLTTYGTLGRAPVAARARVGPRRARRGAGHQEPGRQADARRQGPARRARASRSRARRSRTASATSGRSSTSSRRACSAAPSSSASATKRMAAREHRRLRAAAQPRPPLHPAPPEDRQARHRRPARQDRGHGVLRLTRVQAALYQRAVDELARDARQSARASSGAGRSSPRSCASSRSATTRRTGSATAPGRPTASGKLARLREICEPIAARQEKVLVFTQFREMTGAAGGVPGGRVRARRARAARVGPGQAAQGAASTRSRTRAGRRSSCSRSRRAARASTSRPPRTSSTSTAGGTPPSRTRRPTAPSASARSGTSLVHKFVCRGTVEERIDALIASKRALAESVVEGEGEIRLTELKDEELMRLVCLDLGSALGEEA